MNQLKRDLLGLLALLAFTAITLGMLMIWAIAVKGQKPEPEYVHISSLAYDGDSNSLTWTYTYGDFDEAGKYQPGTDPVTCELAEGEKVAVCDGSTYATLPDDVYQLVTREAQGLLEHAYNIRALVESHTGGGQRASK